MVGAGEGAAAAAGSLSSLQPPPSSFTVSGGHSQKRKTNRKSVVNTGDRKKLVSKFQKYGSAEGPEVKGYGFNLLGCAIKLGSIIQQVCCSIANFSCGFRVFCGTIGPPSLTVTVFQHSHQ